MTDAMDYKAIPASAKLELYVSPTCPYCRKAREHYDSVGKTYELHDAANDDELRHRMLSLTGGDPTVPAIVVDGTYLRSGWGDPPQG